MLKFKIQLHQRTPNNILQLSKFFWDVRRTVEVFAKQYELHYQQKKIKKGDDEDLNAQFECITFHPHRYEDKAKLTPTMKNKWSYSWAKA
jgi:hypothetical protein